MHFEVNFNNKYNVEVCIDDSLTCFSHIRVPVKEIIEMIHTICDDLDMVRPQDMENLKEAIDRFNYLTKVED